MMQFAGYPGEIGVYNSGGWVVDTVEPNSIYGAAIILVDETLQTTSLRMYNQAASTEEYAVRVEEATHSQATTNTFYQRIRSLVRPERAPWKAFADSVASSLNVHAQLLWEKIHQ
ncbi:MAG TPA: hypothetical protein VFN35_30560 [Ktedonobacteraceae bacterium]|nr:hypothetical protein [Ktedonobacteraceae bacterium]